MMIIAVDDDGDVVGAIMTDIPDWRKAIGRAADLVGGKPARIWTTNS